MPHVHRFLMVLEAEKVDNCLGQREAYSLNGGFERAHRGREVLIFSLGIDGYLTSFAIVGLEFTLRRFTWLFNGRAQSS